MSCFRCFSWSPKPWKSGRQSWQSVVFLTQVVRIQLVSETLPSAMTAGQISTVSVTMKNTGSMTWNEAAMIRLGAVGDGSGDANKFGPVRIQIPVGTSVPPGAQYTFTFTMTAPVTKG